MPAAALVGMHCENEGVFAKGPIFLAHRGQYVNRRYAPRVGIFQEPKKRWTKYSTDGEEKTLFTTKIAVL
jgi:hypothetical protein